MFAGSYRAGSRVEACQDYELIGYPQGAAAVAGRLVHGPVEDAVRLGSYDAGPGGVIIGKPWAPRWMVGPIIPVRKDAHTPPGTAVRLAPPTA